MVDKALSPKSNVWRQSKVASYYNCDYYYQNISIKLDCLLKYLTRYIICGMYNYFLSFDDKNIPHLSRKNNVRFSLYTSTIWSILSKKLGNIRS
jgi:hypothetical protein